jgi:hypothetical protein
MLASPLHVILNLFQDPFVAFNGGLMDPETSSG